MDEIGRLGVHLLVQAVLVWTGWGQAPKPLRDDARLTDRFGEELALELVPLIRRLQSEFYESDAYNTVEDPGEMGAEAARRFRALHPELPADVAEAFAWCYTYDWK